MMSRKKKTQHIGHDPLAWLAENDPAQADAVAESAESESTPVTVSETDSVINNAETDSLAMENHAAPAAPTDNTDNIDETEKAPAADVETVTASTESDETETIPDSADDAEKAPAADAETVAAPTESVVTVNAENAAEDLVASSNLETDSAASLLAIDTLDDDMTDEAEQQTFAAHTLIADADYPTEMEFSEEDFTTNMRTEQLLSGWTAVNLPSVLTLSELSDLYQQLSSLRGQRIRLSGENVSRIDTASLQLLVALMRDEETTVGWTNVSPVLCNAAQMLGLAGELNLNGCELEME